VSKDGYSNQNGGGFSPPLTEEDSINFVKKMSAEAAKYGISTGLKNAESILDRVEPYVQFAVNEQCHQYSGCEVYSGFVANKPVYNIEYSGASSAPSVCNTPGFSTIIKNLDLNNYAVYCDGSSVN
jgi:hypothetical protein